MRKSGGTRATRISSSICSRKKEKTVKQMEIFHAGAAAARAAAAGLVDQHREIVLDTMEVTQRWSSET